MNKLNQQAKSRKTHRERADLKLSPWEGVCMRGVEGLSKKEKKRENLMDRDNSGDCWGREVKEGTVGIQGDGQRPDLGWGTHNAVYR